MIVAGHLMHAGTAQAPTPQRVCHALLPPGHEYVHARTRLCFRPRHPMVHLHRTCTHLQTAGSQATPGKVVGQLHDLAREVRVGSSKAWLADIRTARSLLRSRLALSVAELVLQVVHVLLQLLAPVPLPVQLHLRYTCTLALPHWSQHESRMQVAMVVLLQCLESRSHSPSTPSACLDADTCSCGALSCLISMRQL